MAEGIRTTLQQAAAWCSARLQGDDAVFHGVATDTRALEAGTLFIALRGEHFDAHDFAADAVAAGAAALLVERPLPFEVPQLIVDDARLALGRLAAAWRRECGPTVVAVTGSNGKTTVKEMSAAILGQMGETLATRGNLNNDIGVPLTLLRLTPSHRYAVIEMGANHLGEIAYLSALARPDVALVNNAAAAHLAGFGSLEGVAKAKGEIYGGLGDEGIAVINADDRFAPLWQEMAAGHRVMRFGLDREADIRAAWSPEALGSRLTLRLAQQSLELHLALAGRHNVANALAAATVAIAAGADTEAVGSGLATMRPVSGRLQPRAGLAGAQIIDDTYNANPASLHAAVDVLAACPGRRYLALGDMAELGEGAEGLHAAAGREARAAGLDGLYATGTLSRAAVEAFGEGGHFYPQQEALIAELQGQLAADVTVLVKGSRSARMERVVEALTVGEER